MTLLQICEWLESTRVAELVTQSLYGFQILVATHLMGLGLSVGTVIWSICDCWRCWSRRQSQRSTGDSPRGC